MFRCQHLSNLFKWILFFILVLLSLNLYLLHSVSHGSLNHISNRVKILSSKFRYIRSHFYIFLCFQVNSESFTVKNALKPEPTNTTLLATQKIEEQLSSVGKFFETFEIPILYNDQFHSLTVQKNVSSGQNLWKMAAKVRIII